MRDGLLLVDKEPGGTSHDVVQEVRRIVGQKKVGHCGTLDPDATGLLLLTLGRATRLTRFLIRAPKVYSGHIRFGVVTDTYDAAGEVVERHPVDDLDHERIERAMERFVGTYDQITPAYSAKKVKGKKLYELARSGEEVPLEKKEVTVFEFAATGPLEDATLPFRLSCSSGTYARSIAHELGAAVGCGAHLERLRRLQIGPFEVGAAGTLGELRDAFADGGEPGDAWVPFDRIPLPFTELTADAQQEQRLTHGQTVLVRDLPAADEEGDWVKLINRRREFIAVGHVTERFGEGGAAVIQPKIVFR